MRWRDPAATDPRFRHSRPSAGRPRQFGANGVAVGQAGGHADRRRLCRHGRPRCIRRMVARACRGGWREAANRPVQAFRTRRNRQDHSFITRNVRAMASTVEKAVRTRALIGADGALSAVARQCLPGADRLPYVFAYHEIVRSPPTGSSFDGTRCDVYYRGSVSPDFYGWVFPHGDTVSVGTGSRAQGIFAARFRRRFARCCGAWRLRDHPPRRRADPAASVAAVGRRPQRLAGRRCRGRRGASVGRGHLLRHDWRAVVGRSGRRVPGNRRCEGVAYRAKALHAACTASCSGFSA